MIGHMVLCMYVCMTSEMVKEQERKVEPPGIEPRATAITLLDDVEEACLSAVAVVTAQ